MRAVAFVADTEDGANRSRELLDAAKELATMREADADSGPTASLPEALQAIREHDGDTIAPAGLTEALRARPGWDWLKSARRLAGPAESPRDHAPAGPRRRSPPLVRPPSGRPACASSSTVRRDSQRGEEPDGTTPSSFPGSNPVTSGASGDNPHE